MLQSWYQKTAQSLVNTLLSFSWCNRLPYQQYDLLKTPLIAALGAYNSKTTRWIFFVLSTFDKHDKTHLLAKFKKILYLGFRTTFNFWKFKVALNLTQLSKLLSIVTDFVVVSNWQKEELYLKKNLIKDSWSGKKPVRHIYT